MSSLDPRLARRRRPSRRRRGTLLAVAALVVAALVFLVGLSLGRALEDGPSRPRTATVVRTLDPLPLPPATATVTVTAP